MENKNVGLLIIGIALVIGIIVWIFNSALINIVGQTCTHGSSCTMYDTIKTQTLLSLSIAGVILIIGLFIMFTKPKEKIVVRTKKEKRIKKDYSSLDKDEKKEKEDLMIEDIWKHL